MLRDLVVNYAHDAFLVTEGDLLDLPGPRILYVNPAFTRMTGFTPEEVMGKSPRILQGPDTDKNTLKLLSHALRTCKPAKVEIINYRKDGTPFWVELDIQPIKDEDGWVTHFISIQRDITEQKKSERFLSAQKRILEQIASGDSLPEVLTAITRMIDIQTQDVFASIMLLNPDGQTLRVGAAPSLPANYVRMLEGLPIGPEIGCCGAAVFSGKQTISEDISTDHRWPDPFRSTLLAADIHSCWSWPILTQKGDVLGTFALYTKEKRRPSVAEVDMVSDAAHLAGIAIEHSYAEEQIEAQRRRYIYLFDTNPQPLLLYDRNAACFTNVNQAARKLYGYSLEEFQSLPLKELFAETDQADFLTEFETEGRTTTTGKIWLHRQKSGASLEVELSWQSLPWEMRSSVLLSVSDVTRREVARRDAEVWRERYEMALASFDRIFYVWYPLTDKVLLQGAFEKVFGYNTEEYPRTTAEWREMVHPSDRMRILPEVENALHHHQPFTLRYRVKTKHGDYVYVEDQGHFIQDAEGQILNVVGFIGDITEKIKLEMQMEQSQRLDAMGHLASGIAHDFANLLMVINGSAELLALPDDTSPLTEDQRSLIANIREATARATELTSQLMTFSRGHSSIDTITDVNRALLDMRWLLQSMMPKHIQLRIEPSDTPLLVLCQRAPIDQIITNLTLNSRDAIVQAGEIAIWTGEVHLSQSQRLTAGHLLPGKYALLEIADSGTGIDPDLMPRIFEPFFTTKPVDKGTGLGLATVYGIIRQAGGAIHVESALGKGTTIRVYLPLAAEETAALKIDSATAAQTTILLADSDTEDRLLTAGILRDCGFHVLEASDAEEAITQATLYRESLDILITRTQLSGISGIELAETLHLLRPSIRILHIYDRPEGAASVRAGQSTYALSTPFTPAMLRQKIAQLLFPVRTE
ncbi:MAG: hybrid sensor histidine kinase/response regulator [Acidobacteriaceae bacterium]